MDPTALRLAFAVVLDGPSGPARCTARELSARGIVVESRALHPVGARLTVTFSLPDGSFDETVACTVSAVHSRGDRHALSLAFATDDTAV